MADILFFMKSGWKNIWTHKNILLWSGLTLFPLIFYFYQPSTSWGVFDLALSLFLLATHLIIIMISLIGVPYLAYCYITGQGATMQETLSAIRKFFWRAIGCSCLGLTLFLPIVFFVIISSIDGQTGRFEIPSRIFLWSLPLSAISAFWDFVLFGFFANDWGIRKSLQNAWFLFKANFNTLAVLGITITLLYGSYSALSGTITVLLQSNFEIDALSQLNYLNPATTLAGNLTFSTIYGIGNVLLIPFRASIFASAYTKYSDSASIPLTRAA